MSAQPLDAKVLALIPDGAIRVKVTDAKGKLHWREIPDILPTDTLVINPATGMAFRMLTQVGRKVGYRKTSKASPTAPPKKGRPKKVQGTPAQVVALPVFSPPAPPNPKVDILREKRRAIKKDRLVRSVNKDAGSASILSYVIQELAEEVAALKFERIQSEKQNKDDVSQVSVKRVQALRTLGETWLRRREQLAANELNIDSPSFQALFKFISDTFAQALINSNVRPEVIEVIFSNFSKLLTDDWKNEARGKVKSS